MERKEHFAGERILRVDFKSLKIKGDFKGVTLNIISQSVLKQAEGEEAVFWIETHFSGAISELDGDCCTYPVEKSDGYENFKDLIEQNNYWNLGTPTTDIKQEFQEIVWREFQKRKLNAYEDFERIQEVEAKWAKVWKVKRVGEAIL